MTSRSASIRRGFSLIEIAVLIVIMGIAAAGILTLYGAISKRTVVTDDLQRGVLLVESCAEVVISSRALLTATFPTNTNPWSSTGASCATDNSPAICECHALTAGDFTPYTPKLTAYRNPYPATPAAVVDYGKRCVDSSVTGPVCVTVEIEAVNTATNEVLGAPVVVQLQAY